MVDEHERRVWRRVRDAADDHALTFLAGTDPAPTEPVLRAALLTDPVRRCGLLGMLEIHRSRARQLATDGEWVVAHDLAARDCVARIARLRLALREAVVQAGSAGALVGGGAGTGATVVALARELGGAHGSSEPWLVRALRELEIGGALEGARTVARELVSVGEREERVARRYLRLGIIAPHELPSTVRTALTAMWRSARAQGHRSEVLALLERRVLAALDDGDFHAVYAAQQEQYAVSGQAFLGPLQAEVDAVLAAWAASALAAPVPGDPVR